MNDIENAARQALRQMLEPIEPGPGLDPHTVRGAKRRRAAAITVAAVVAVAMLAGASWAAMSLGGSAPNGRRLAPAHEDAVGPRLYLAGDGELWSVDLDGRVEHEATPELGPGDPPFRIVERDGRLVAWGYETYRVDPELVEPPRAIVDDSLYFIPSSHHDRVWVAVGRAGMSLDAVREVTVDGDVTVSDVRPPGGASPVASLDSGLLFPSPTMVGAGGYELWDPGTGEVVSHFTANTLGPVTGDLITSCNADCRAVRVTDVSGGVVGEIGLPDGYDSFQLWSGSFSPDGRTLAVPIRRDAGPGGATAVDLALIDMNGATTRSGPAMSVPRVVKESTTHPFYNFVAWTPSGDYVFFTGGRPSEQRTILVYRIGDAAAARLDVAVGDFYGAAAL